MTHMGRDSPPVFTHSCRCWTEKSSVGLSASVQAHEDSQESVTSLPRRDTMGSYLPDSASYDLLAVIGVEMTPFILVGLRSRAVIPVPDGLFVS